MLPPDCRSSPGAGYQLCCTAAVPWEDPTGQLRFWEAAERTTRRGEVDGVAMLAKVLLPPGRPACVHMAGGVRSLRV